MHTPISHMTLMFHRDADNDTKKHARYHDITPGTEQKNELYIEHSIIEKMGDPILLACIVQPDSPEDS